jgi:hypothetical protein
MEQMGAQDKVEREDGRSRGFRVGKVSRGEKANGYVSSALGDLEIG